MMNPAASDALKKYQVQFLTSVARWANYGTEIESTTVDLPNIVCMLQSVGYTLRRIDFTSPDEIGALREGQKGTTVVITCGHSGQRCILELPEEPEQCKCLFRAENSQDSFWEVTATNSNSKNSSIIETGSGAVPTVSKDLNILLKNMLIFLTHMIQGSLEDVEENLSKSTSSLVSNTSKGATSSPKKDAKRLSGFIKDMVNPPIIISSPKGKDSPARYRSLDTLTKNPDEILPMPGSLTPKPEKTVDISQSSPAINLCKNEFTNSSESTIGDSNHEKVIQLLHQAILILQTNGSHNVSPATPNRQATFVTGKPASKSIGRSKRAQSSTSNLAATKRLLREEPKGKNNLKGSKLTSSGTNIARPISKSTPKSTTVNPAVETKCPVTKSAEPKVVEEKDRKSITKPRKLSNLYAHVKSTIPKPSPSGNFITKKE